MKMVPVQVLLPSAFFVRNRNPNRMYHMFEGEGVVGPSANYLKVTNGKVFCGPCADDRRWLKLSELKEAYNQYMSKQQPQSQVTSSDPRDQSQEQCLRDQIKKAIREYNDAGYEEVATVSFSYT